MNKKNMGKTASKKKHEPPPSSNETQTTTSTYLSTHLIVPYFITANGTIKRPEHLIAWWSRIFYFYVPDDKDRIELRYLCRLFRDALKPPPLHTTFPHPNYWALNKLVDKLNNVYEEDPVNDVVNHFLVSGHGLLVYGELEWGEHTRGQQNEEQQNIPESLPFIIGRDEPCELLLLYGDVLFEALLHF